MAERTPGRRPKQRRYQRRPWLPLAKEAVSQRWGRWTIAQSLRRPLSPDVLYAPLAAIEHPSGVIWPPANSTGWASAQQNVTDEGLCNSLQGKQALQPCHLRIADLDDGRGCDLLSGWRGPRLPYGQGPDPGPADAQTRRDDVVGIDPVEVLEACRAASGSMARSAASRSRNTRMRTIWS